MDLGRLLPLLAPKPYGYRRRSSETEGSDKGNDGGLRKNIAFTTKNPQASDKEIIDRGVPPSQVKGGDAVCKEVVCNSYKFDRGSLELLWTSHLQRFMEIANGPLVFHLESVTST